MFKIPNFCNIFTYKPYFPRLHFKGTMHAGGAYHIALQYTIDPKSTTQKGLDLVRDQIFALLTFTITCTCVILTVDLTIHLSYFN